MDRPDQTIGIVNIKSKTEKKQIELTYKSYEQIFFRGLLYLLLHYYFSE